MDTVEKLRNANPDFTFTTDIIVGFPGETDADHQDTLEMIRLTKFTKVHMFAYSPRPRTRAALMPNKVPPEVVQERKHEVLRLAESVSFELRQGYVGRKMTVLTESRDESTGLMSGHTANFLQVWIDDPHVKSNEIIEVLMTENQPQGLMGAIQRAH